MGQQKVQLSDLGLSLLGQFLGLRVNELILEQVEKAGFTNFRESHGYVIMHFIDADRSITELGKRMEVSQQAASKMVAELAGMGMLEPAPSKDRRSKRMRLSEQGWALVRTTREAREKIENRLIKKIGQKKYDESRTLLIECLTLLGDADRITTRRIRSPR